MLACIFLVNVSGCLWSDLRQMLVLSNLQSFLGVLKILRNVNGVSSLVRSLNRGQVFRKNVFRPSGPIQMTVLPQNLIHFLTLAARETIQLTFSK